MAHTNQTPNYELSQFLGTDKPAWLVDYNGDMEKIDLGLKAAKDVADTAKEEADQGAIDIAAVTLTANSADAKASGAVSDISDAYDATSTYDLGDLVIYNNLLYKCTTAITVPETFDGTHWTRITIEELIDTINNNLTDKLEPKYMDDITSWTQLFNRVYSRSGGGGVVSGYCNSTISTDQGKISYYGYIYPGGLYGSLMIISFNALVIVSVINGVATNTRITG